MFKVDGNAVLEVLHALIMLLMFRLCLLQNTPSKVRIPNNLQSLFQGFACAHVVSLFWQEHGSGVDVKLG